MPQKSPEVKSKSVESTNLELEYKRKMDQLYDEQRAKYEQLMVDVAQRPYNNTQTLRLQNKISQPIL